MALPFLTVGHSTRTVSEFVRLLEAGGVQTVVDIRTIPRSRTNPQFNGDALPGSLEPFGIRYEYFAELGVPHPGRAWSGLNAALQESLHSIAGGFQPFDGCAPKPEGWKPPATLHVSTCEMEH